MPDLTRGAPAPVLYLPRPSAWLLWHDYLFRPGKKVLDIACGVGRLAYALRLFFDEGGSYTGFDVAPQAIDWLNSNYAPQLPNFRFDLVDVKNPLHRPDEGQSATNLDFPYGDGSFDVACTFALFMHMQLPEIENYLREIRRVLRPGGVGVLNFSAIRPDGLRSRYAGRDFVAIGAGVYTRFPEKVGVAMAYDHDLILRTIEANGLQLLDVIEGYWRHPWIRTGEIHTPTDIYAVTPQ